MRSNTLGFRPDDEVPLSSCFPRSQNRDRGHPSVVQNQAVKELGDFDQFHLPVAAAMEDEQSVIGIVEDEQIAVAELEFHHGLL